MPEFATATLTATSDLRGRPIPEKQRRPLTVHFNPEKLELTITNAMEQNRNRRRREPPQLVTESSAKLSLELVFDTTDTGRDVRAVTFGIAQMMQPRPGPRQQGQQRGVPAIALFEWGSFVFEGYIDSYRETLDFFAPEGVPLRSTLSLSLTEQAQPFRPPKERERPAEVGQEDMRLSPTNPDESVDALARRLGVPRGGADAIAQDNGIESRRRPGVEQVAVPERPAPRPPPPQDIAEARAGAAAPQGAAGRQQAGAGAFAGASAGAFAGASADASAGAFAGASAGAFAGATATATATAGGGGGATLAGFADLRAPPEIRLEPPRLDFGGGIGASSASLELRGGVDLGGVAGAQAGLAASGGLRPGGGITAEVGASAEARIIIEDS